MSQLNILYRIRWTKFPKMYRKSKITIQYDVFLQGKKKKTSSLLLHTVSAKWNRFVLANEAKLSCWGATERARHGPRLSCLLPTGLRSLTQGAAPQNHNVIQKCLRVQWPWELNTQQLKTTRRENQTPHKVRKDLHHFDNTGTAHTLTTQQWHFRSDWHTRQIVERKMYLTI